MADDTVAETPIEEWRQSNPDKRGRTYEYIVLKGPGGGLIRRQGAETPDEARVRHAVAQEAKRRTQRDQAAPPKQEGPKPKGRKPDRPPTPRATPDVNTPAKGKPSQAQLAAAAELPFAVLGAFIGRGVLGCDYCAMTMQANAGRAAADVAKSKNPYIVNLLVWWHGLMAGAAGAEGLALFAGVPVIHHMAPQPMYEFVAPFMGMPARQQTPKSAPHTHGATPPPAGPPAGGGTPTGTANGAGGQITPQEADIIARTPGLFEALQAGDPRALQYLEQIRQQEREIREAVEATMKPEDLTGAPVGGQEQAELAELQAEKARLEAEAAARTAQVSDMAARELARQAAMPAGNIPTYRAEDTLNPVQLRQMQEAEASRNMPGGLPNYNGGDRAAGTPSAPPADTSASAGSPLPPEAETL